MKITDDTYDTEQQHMVKSQGAGERKSNFLK